MKPIVPITIGLVGLIALVALAGDDEDNPRDLTVGDPFKLTPMTAGEALGIKNYPLYFATVQKLIKESGGTFYVNGVYPIDDRPAVVAGDIPPMPNHFRPKDAAWLREVSDNVLAIVSKRHAALAPYVTDKTSPAYAALYQGPWVPFMQWTGSAFKTATWNRNGLNPSGASTNLWGAALTAAGYVLPMVPGIGTAANAALQGAIALGQGKSLDEAALAAIRGTLPPWGQVAFDLGVGVALQGKSIDQAAIDAGLNQLEVEYPGAKKAYADGKALTKELGL